MLNPNPNPGFRPPDYDKRVALVLQGGGALGSYQAGVYEAMAAANYLPDWVAGISIGAINAAIIAGNPPETRVDQLRSFWEEITRPAPLWSTGVELLWPPSMSAMEDAQRRAGALGAIVFGLPGFYAPRGLMDWLPGTSVTSYYNTSALRGTLERLVDFDRINARDIRFSVGAVNIQTGRFAYFDNETTKICPEHVMASGALPPGFPPVEIDGQFYWDGGLISNTPLLHVLEATPRLSRLTFQVDLFQAYGPLPTSLENVAEREKDIRYASRTRAATERLETMHNIRSHIHDLWELLPDDIRKLPQARFMEEMRCDTDMDIVQLIYRPFSPQGASKDFEFSRITMNDRWNQGREDADVNLRAAPWLEPHPPELGTRVFDVLHDIYVREAGLILEK